MAMAPNLAVTLLLSGLLIGSTLLVQVVAVRSLPVKTIPEVLRPRVTLSTRLRPWLLFAAATMVAVGMVLQTYE